jgi:hypothetical protein
MSGARAVLRPWARVGATIAFAATALIGAGRVTAEDPPPPKPPAFAELVVAHKAAVEAGDAKRQAELLNRLCDLAGKPLADPADEAAAKRREEDRKTARGLCRKSLSAREQEVVVAALTGYGTLRISGSSADLRPFADAELGAKKPLPVRLAAIEAWAVIHDQGAHATLLEHIRLPHTDQEKKSLAVASARGLAEWKALPKGGARYEMLRDFMQTFDTILVTSSSVATAAGWDWWQLLQPVMTKSFNEITKAGAANHAACVEWWRENRRKVQSGNA